MTLLDNETSLENDIDREISAVGSAVSEAVGLRAVALFDVVNEGDVVTEGEVLSDVEALIELRQESEGEGDMEMVAERLRVASTDTEIDGDVEFVVERELVLVSLIDVVSVRASLSENDELLLVDVDCEPEREPELLTDAELLLERSLEGDRDGVAVLDDDATVAVISLLGEWLGDDVSLSELLLVEELETERDIVNSQEKERLRLSDIDTA